MTTLEFYFDIEPVAKQSFKQGKHGGYTPANVKKCSNTISLMAKSQLPPMFEKISEPIIVDHIHFFFTPGKTLMKSKIKQNRFAAGMTMPKPTKPDLDNLNKLVWDALEGIVFENDSRIIAIKDCQKKYRSKKGIYIKLHTV